MNQEIVDHVASECFSPCLPEIPNSLRMGPDVTFGLGESTLIAFNSTIYKIIIIPGYRTSQY